MSDDGDILVHGLGLTRDELRAGMLRLKMSGWPIHDIRARMACDGNLSPCLGSRVAAEWANCNGKADDHEEQRVDRANRSVPE